MTPAAFAVPGDITLKTGGYVYDRRVIAELRAAGRDVTHVALPGGFPAPDAGQMAAALAQLAAVPPGRVLIVDGLAFGALETAGVARIAAPIVAMVHHPLGLETGLAPDRAAALVARERANLAHAAQVVVPSAHVGETLARDFGVDAGRITVAGPGFDRPEGAPAPEEPPLILSVGSLTARKGHDVLIRALARISDLAWRAEIVGAPLDPAVAAASSALARDVGLAGRLTFTGGIDAAALSARYHAATVFALASRYEGYGMVFAEAMLHGLPVVACAAGAVPGVVPPEAGTLVPVDDVEAFAAALRRLLGDPAFRAAQAAGAAAAAARLPHWTDTAAAMAAAVERAARG